jgi:hypothetical protein
MSASGTLIPNAVIYLLSPMALKVYAMRVMLGLDEPLFEEALPAEYRELPLEKKIEISREIHDLCVNYVWGQDQETEA